MKTRKILIPIFSRGNYAKLKNVILELRKYKNCEVEVIVGGTATLDKYGDLRSTLVDHGIPNIKEINFVVSGENLSSMRKTAGLAALEFSTFFDQSDPDIVLVLADRFECLPLAMIARYSNKCIVHLEGGEITGSVDDSIRHSISKLSNYHFVANENAKKLLGLIGEKPDTIYVTGSTSLDEFVRANISGLNNVRTKQSLAGLGPELKIQPKQYGVCIFHPVTTEYDENFDHCRALIESLSSIDFEMVWLWPNMDAGSDGVSKAIRLSRECKPISNIHFFKSLPIEEYAPLLKYSAFIIGNSSSGIREAGFVGVPSISVGSRQRGREHGANVLSVAATKREIDAGLDKIRKLTIKPNDMYGKGEPSSAVAKLLSVIEIKNEKFHET